MNFVEYTEKQIEKVIDGYKAKRILVIGAGYKIDTEHKSMDLEHEIIQHDPKKDIAEWICEYRDSDKFEPFDVIIASRVLEHIPIRNIDWYICCIYSIMKAKGKLIAVVPDMSKVVEALEEEFTIARRKDLFKIHRLHFELFSEGNNVWDRHCTWMTPNSIRYYLEMEGLFTVKSMSNIRLDSDIVPDEIEVIAERK